MLDIKNDLKQHLTFLIESKLDPIVEQLTTLTSTIKEVTMTANAAMEGSIKNEGLMTELKAAEHQLRDRIAWLEQWGHTLNLKLRGVPDSTEINRDLLQNITAWLTPFLQLEENASVIQNCIQNWPCNLHPS